MGSHQLLTTQVYAITKLNSKLNLNYTPTY